MLIGVNGFKGAGKSTVGEYLAEQYDFKLASFAALLKQSAAALFGIDVDNWEEWKNDDRKIVTISSDDYPYEGPPKILVMLTVREFLQRYGTESHRDVFGYDFWVDNAFKNLDVHSNNYVFTDARFDNELRAIKNRGGLIIRVERDVEGSADAHPSEQPPDPDLVDVVIDNNGSFEDLYNQIDDFVASTFLEEVQVG